MCKGNISAIFNKKGIITVLETDCFAEKKAVENRKLITFGLSFFPFSG